MHGTPPSAGTTGTTGSALVAEDVSTKPKPVLAQRAACDRCRGQKLRCPRTKPGSQSICDRCQRIGAVCRTAPRLPSGRPSLRGANGSATKSRLKRTKTYSNCKSTPLVVKPINLTALPSPSTSATHSPLLETTAHSSTCDQPSPLDIEQSCLFEDSAVNSLSTFDSVLCYNFDFGASSPENDHDAITSLGSAFEVFESDFSQLSGSSCYGSSSPVESAKYPCAERICQSSDIFAPDYSFATPRSFIESISAISERVSDLQAHQWINTWDPAGRSDDSTPVSPQTISSPLDEDNFSRVTLVLTEFYILSHLQGAKSSNLIMGSTDTAPKASLPTVLMLLSAYVQIGQLVASLLGRIRQRCQEIRLTQFSTSNDSTRLAGWQHSLYVKLQLLESHCNSLVRSINQSQVPDLEEDDSKNKIYCSSAESSSILIRTMTSQAQDTFRSLMQDFERVRCEILGM